MRKRVLATALASPIFASACVAAAVSLPLSLSVAACKGGGSREAARALFGELQAHPAAQSIDLAPYLATARAIALRAPRPQPDPPPGEASRVFVTVWTKPAPVTATALGASLLASVVEASEAAAREVAKVAKAGGDGGAPPDARVQLDVVSGVEPTAFEEEIVVRPPDAGTFGYVVGDKEHLGFALPIEMITRRWIDTAKLEDGAAKVDRARLVGALVARAGVDAKALLAHQAWRVRTLTRVDSVPPGRALVVTRAHLDPQPPPSPAQLVDAVRAGAEYLSRVIDDKGRYVYMYRPVEDEVERSYGLLRHAGSTYALLEAHGELRAPLYLDKARLALAYMKSRLRSTPDGSYLLDNADEEQQKVGGGGLALVALAANAEITGARDDLETMRALARFIVHQQYPDGHFRANADVMREDESVRGKHLKREVSYFPGEAILGLLRLHRVDPQPQWLEAAKRGADYLIRVRDAHESEDTQIHDHWLSYALDDLVRATGDASYAEHAWKIARAILKGQKTAATAPAPDYVGTFYDFAETTPASTRLEALAADLELSRWLGAKEDWLARPAIAIARYTRMEQYDVESAFYARDPARVIGGVRESLANVDVRIDYVQHAMCGWLHLARILRDPAYATRAPTGERAATPASTRADAP